MCSCWVSVGWKETLSTKKNFLTMVKVIMYYNVHVRILTEQRNELTHSFFFFFIIILLFLSVATSQHIPFFAISEKICKEAVWHICEQDLHSCMWILKCYSSLRYPLSVQMLSFCSSCVLCFCSRHRALHFMTTIMNNNRKKQRSLSFFH